MKKIILIAAIFSVATIITTSCSKEKGCTDVQSKTYSTTAEEDDGSCTYDASIVFWYDLTAATNATNAGVTTLTYYVDGVIVGSADATVYWVGAAPDCGATGTITVKKDLGLSKSKIYSYNIKDQNGVDQWNGSITFNTALCTVVQL